MKDFCIYDLFNTTEDEFMNVFDTKFDVEVAPYIPTYKSKIDLIIANKNYNICSKKDFMKFKKDYFFNSTLEYLNEDFGKISMLPLSLLLDWFNSEVSASHSRNLTPFIITNQIIKDSIAFKILLNGNEHKIDESLTYYNSILYKAAFRSNNIPFERRLAEVTTRVFDHSKKNHIGKGVESNFSEFKDNTPLISINEYKSLVYDVYYDLFNIANSGKNLYDVDLSILKSVIEYEKVYKTTKRDFKDIQYFNECIINEEIDSLIRSSEIEVFVNGENKVLAPKMNFLKIVDIEDKAKRYKKEINELNDTMSDLYNEKSNYGKDIQSLAYNIDTNIDVESTKTLFSNIDMNSKALYKALKNRKSNIELKNAYKNILDLIVKQNSIKFTIFKNGKKVELYEFTKEFLEDGIENYVDKSLTKYVFLFLETIKDYHREEYYNFTLGDFKSVVEFKNKRSTLVDKRRELDKEITALENDIQDRELFFKMKHKDGVMYSDNYNAIDKRNHHSLTRFSSKFRDDLFGSYTEFDITNSLFQVISQVVPKFKFREETSIDLTNVNYYLNNRETIISKYFDGSFKKDEYKAQKQNYLSSLGQSKAVSVPKEVDFKLDNGLTIRDFNANLRDEVKKIKNFLKCLPSFKGNITIDGHDFEINLDMRNLLDEIRSLRNRDFNFTDNNVIHYFYFQIEAQIMETLKERYLETHSNVFRIHDAIYFM